MRSISSQYPQWLRWSGLASASSPTTPFTIQGTLKLWLDATDNSTITQSGGLVSQWRDKSPNAYTYSQSSGSDQPDLSTINGLQAIHSVTDFLTQDAPGFDLPDASAFLLACALRSDNGGAYQAIFQIGSGSVQNAVFHVSDGSNSLTLDNSVKGWGVENFQYPIPNPGNVTALCYYTGSAWSFVRVNGANRTIVAGAPGSPTLIGGLFGWSGLDPTYVWHGSIGEIILIYNPTANDRTNAISYMETRWGASP